METKIATDIGEEIILRLKELQEIIRKKLLEKNEKELQNTSEIR